MTPPTNLRMGSIAMGPDNGTVWGSLAAALIAGVAVLWRGYGKMRRADKVDATDVETLAALNAAVVQWKSLYDTAWRQVNKERELREVAEKRAAMAFAEIEKLRSEVATLRREIEKLTALVQDHRIPPDFMVHPGGRPAL